MNVIADTQRAYHIVSQENNYNPNNPSNLKPGYFSTNECLKYFKELDIQDKFVLTVCSSGDHAFWSLISGAKCVDTFDNNPLQYYIMELKRAAIIALTKEEYCLFFPIHYGNLEENYNYKYYLKLRQYLHQDSRVFWDKIYTINKPPIYLLEKLSYPLIFDSDYTRYYDILKEKLIEDSITYTDCNITQLNTHFHNKYQLIILSNIYDHLSYYTDMKEQEYLDIIKDKIFPLLEDGGTCLFHYQRPEMPQSFKSYEEINTGYNSSVKVLRKVN